MELCTCGSTRSVEGRDDPSCGRWNRGRGAERDGSVASVTLETNSHTCFPFKWSVVNNAPGCSLTPSCNRNLITSVSYTGKQALGTF